MDSSIQLQSWLFSQLYPFRPKCVVIYTSIDVIRTAFVQHLVQMHCVQVSICTVSHYHWVYTLYAVQTLVKHKFVVQDQFKAIWKPCLLSGQCPLSEGDCQAQTIKKNATHTRYRFIQQLSWKEALLVEKTSTNCLCDQTPFTPGLFSAYCVMAPAQKKPHRLEKPSRKPRLRYHQCTLFQGSCQLGKPLRTNSVYCAVSNFFSFKKTVKPQHSSIMQC